MTPATNLSHSSISNGVKQPPRCGPRQLAPHTAIGILPRTSSSTPRCRSCPCHGSSRQKGSLIMNARHALALIVIAVASLCLLLGATGMVLWSVSQDTPLDLLVYVWLPLFLVGAGLMVAGISQYRKSDHRLEAVADPRSGVRRTVYVCPACGCIRRWPRRSVTNRSAIGLSQ
jgi:hypothetical protein